MKAEYERLCKRLAQISAQLDSFPTGKLLCAKNGSAYKWYQSDGKTKSYIPKSNRFLAEKLAEKKYLTCLFHDLSQEKTAIEFYLRHHAKVQDTASQLLHDAPEYQNLLSISDVPLSQELFQWQNAPFERNPLHPENCKIKTASDNLVRSKSEALIAMMLYTNSIPFRYECALPLGSILLYPDFTIRHPKTGNFYYWEHFGMMDNRDYRHHAFEKLRLYIDHGIYPGQQLLTTYETAESPLDTAQIEALITKFFLTL